MAEKARKVYGVDYSEKSVKISRQVNKDLIDKGTVDVKQGNVQNLDYEDNTFDIVTAFETVYFWPDIEKCFGEVKRVLKPGGIFLIGMESNGSDNIAMKISEKLIDMTVYNDEQLTEFLKNNDYNEIIVYLKDTKNKKEKIKTKDGIKTIDDDWGKVSFTDKFVQWMCITAKK